MNVWEMKFAWNWMEKVEDSLQSIAGSLKVLAEQAAKAPEEDHEPKD